MIRLPLVPSLCKTLQLRIHHVQKHSIWGSYWEPVRKWFYPSWLLYELSYRFYQYAIATNQYIEQISNQPLAVFSAVVAFLICTLFLTVPTCFILYTFFKAENLTNTSIEKKLKRYF